MTTEDAASTTPQIIEKLREAGIAVVGIEEHQPTFDEVFTHLVERRRSPGDETATMTSELEAEAHG